MLFGSWFGNWDGTDNFMRAILAAPSLGLTCCMAGVPHWFVHHMGLGETIGYGTRLSMNNSTMYQNQSNLFTRAVYISLMGDPALRQDQLAPPTALDAVFTNGAVTLNWQASADSVLGYHVYRGPSPTGPFARLNSSLVTETIFTDHTASPGSFTYMVRAITLQLSASGSYYNPSQGVLTNLSVPAPTPPIQLSISPGGKGLLLIWTSQTGIVYRVLAKTNFNQLLWRDVSGPLTATGTNCTWSPTNLNSSQQLYRIQSP
jgi:hypothetical protein